MKKILNIILNIFYPHRCVSCKATTKLNEYHICESCLSSIKSIKYQCETCGCPTPFVQDFCAGCRENVILYDQMFASFLYKDALRNIIKAFKYSNKTFLVEFFEEIIIKDPKYLNFLKENKFDLLMPVPIHTDRRMIRGYNQSEILVELFVRKFCDAEVKLDVLTRKKATIPLYELNALERMQELVDAFELSDPQIVRDKNILLVDDICTTGATLNECTRLLKQHGAKLVKAFVIAHG